MSISYCTDLASGAVWGGIGAPCFGRLNKGSSSRDSAVANVKSSTGDRNPVAVSTSVLLNEYVGNDIKKLMVNKSTKANAELYYNWLFQQSWHAPVYVTKSCDEAIERDRISVTCDVEAQVMMSALFCIRYPVLVQGFLKLFCDAVKGGVPEHQAFVLAYHCAENNGSIRKIPQTRNWESNAFCFDKTDPLYLQQFLRGTPQINTQVTIGGTFATELRYQTVIQELYTPTRSGSGSVCFYDLFVKHCRAVMRGAEAPATVLFNVYPNPFIGGDLNAVYKAALDEVSVRRDENVPEFRLPTYDVVRQALERML